MGLAELGLALPPVDRTALLDHLRLLLAWTTAINLTAVRDPVEAVTVHILDALSAVPIVRRLGAARLLDLGSGGGYPGLPLAVATPIRALLVEPIGKKARFLETATAALERTDRIDVAAARAEALAADPEHRGRWPLVTVRAVAAAATLVELAFPLLEVGGTLIAWKRGDVTGELTAAERTAEGLGGGRIAVEHVAIAGLDGHLLVVATKTGPTPSRFPRAPRARERRPW